MVRKDHTEEVISLQRCLNGEKMFTKAVIREKDIAGIEINMCHMHRGDTRHGVF